MGSDNKGKKNLVSLSSGPRRGSSKPGVTGRSHVHETVCYFLAGVFVSYRFDVYRKVPKDLTEPTLTGAVSKFFFSNTHTRILSSLLFVKFSARPTSFS